MLDLDRSLNTSGFDGGGSVLDEAWVAELAAHSSGRNDFQVVSPYRSARVCLSVVRTLEGRREVEPFKKAARRRAAFTHDSALPVIAAGQAPGLLYLGLAAGDSVQLASRLASGPLRPEECIAALAGVSEAVDAAERGGLTVWELTPRSVLIDDRGAGTIGDVGTAREAYGNPDPDTDPQAPWLAPEVFDGETPDVRSCVYSLGTLLYASLTVAAYVGTPSRRGKRRRGRSGADGHVPEISARLDEVIACALAPDPSERFGTAAAFVEAAREAPAEPRAKRAKPPAPAAAPAPAPEPEPAPEAAPAPEPEAAPAPETEAAPRSRPARPRRGPVVALAATVLVLGAVAGRLAAPEAEPAPAPVAATERASGAGVSVTVPADWRAGSAPAGAVAAEDALVRRPRGSGESGLVAGVAAGRIAAGPEWGAPEPVRLGAYEALRYPSEALEGARANLYLTPTSAGTLAITCVAGGATPARFLASCERVASTARLASGQTLPLAERAELRAQLAALSATLAARRAAIRRRLGEAERQRGQAQTAEALAGTYAASAERAGSISGELADALERTASAYRRLSRAALRGDRGGWTQARREVSASEAAVAEALRTSG